MLEIEKLRMPPAYQAVSAELQRFILNGTLKPGQPLPSEIELAAKFGVNRSTVREGIRQLESEGLLRREGRKRLLVAVPGHADLAPKTTRALLMQEVTFRELWEVARALEPLAAGLAAQYAAEEDISRLRANLERTSRCIDEGLSPGEEDLKFHALIAEVANNQALLLAREPIGRLLYPTFEAIRPQIPQASLRNLQAHAEVVLAIEARNPDRASSWMAKHIDDLKRGWLLANLNMDDRIDPSSTFR